MADYDNIQVDGLVEQRKELEALMMSNPAMEKKVQKIIRTVLMTARRKISGEAKSAMKTDPRQAYKAVKTAVYRQILGGSVSILNKKRAGAMSLYEPPRTLRQGQRGGNRVPRSQRTEDVMSYQGADRAFILRFLNAGTGSRTAGTRNGRLHGNRGRIAPRNFFANSSHRYMQQAAEQLTSLIDELIKKETA
jgi:hypothetical protein